MKRGSGNYFFIRIANKAGKIDRYYNFIRVSRFDEKATILWAAAKGEKKELELQIVMKVSGERAGRIGGEGGNPWKS